MNIKTGEELALIAMKKELKVLSKKADKAKSECDEYMNTGSEAVAIHNEFVEIVNAKEHGQKVLDQLDSLKKRRNKVDAIMKKDFIKLMDKDHEAGFTRDNLAQEISMLEFRQSLRTR